MNKGANREDARAVAALPLIRPPSVGGGFIAHKKAGLRPLFAIIFYSGSFSML